jgi:hypothetical protein
MLIEHVTEGVLVAKKDFNAPKHEDLDVPNLEVIKAMQSLTSKGLVKMQFSWQWFYYVLTPEGVEYLREWCVVSEGVPTIVLSSSEMKGFTYPPKLFLLLIKKLPAHLVPLAGDLEARVPTARPVAIVMTTVRRRVLPRASARRHNMLVLAGAVLGNKCRMSIHLFNLYEYVLCNMLHRP